MISGDATIRRDEHLIEDAYARHFVVIGKRNPFADADKERRNASAAESGAPME